MSLLLMNILEIDPKKMCPQPIYIDRKKLRQYMIPLDL